MLKVVASEKASPWEAGLLEEGTGPCHPDPQGECSGSNHDPSLHVGTTWRETGEGAGVRG